MKNIFLAASLIVITTSAVLVAAYTHPKLSEKCNREWEKAFDADSSISNNHLNTDIIFTHQ